ncbi:PREDICTED: probable GMP synthase [glutamine-hydrolyzing] [Brassica oleracea var. oleracea]|uniref:DNA-3-methyladenine glycosylase I n=1 Tax=Brassica oleracea var. oleracea TaxID=109376 RepID=A0A0D3AAI0_BRAOL|nr:PREDICTED: probable GMP synthase [glutamine-hydrolyzing] [Brassica oleracea var. oleracea]
MKLFELLSLSGALAELSWKDILSKRQSFREVFMDFDPVAITNKKITSPDSLLSEQKLRSILENANQVRKIIVEFGSFDKYIWNFVNQKPTQSQFRYQRQVPAKTSKAELISKDLVRRGFRSVSPTVIYSFMQTAGLMNDHLTSCFRHHQCISKDEA